MTHHADIDIDFGNRENIIKLIKHIPASKRNGLIFSRHLSGVYVQPIPIEPITGFSALPFRLADDRGYFKLDFLNVSIYNEIRDQEHYDKLLATEPPWERLQERQFVERLIHVNNYHTQLLDMMPDTIARMAMFISAIRPGKQHLLGKPWKEVGETIWEKTDDTLYVFKKSHSLAYALLVALHMNVLNEKDQSTPPA